MEMKILDLDTKPDESRIKCWQIENFMHVADFELCGPEWLSNVVLSAFVLAKKRNLKIRGACVKLILEDEPTITN